MPETLHRPRGIRLNPPAPMPDKPGPTCQLDKQKGIQGSQFTSPRFTGVLQDAGVRISMDGRGRWMDNVFIERLWRSLKYECVYLHAFETGSELRAGLTWWIGYYNARRPHSTLAGRTPDDTYWASGMKKLAA